MFKWCICWTCNGKQGEESFYLWSLKARIDPKQTKQLVVRCPNKQPVLYWASPPICCHLPALSCYLPLPCPSLQTAAISCHVRLSICEGRIIVPTRKEVDGSALNAPNDRKKNLYAFLSEIKWLVCSHIPCHVALKRKCIMLWSSKNSHCMSYRFANTCVQRAVESKKCEMCESVQGRNTPKYRFYHQNPPVNDKLKNLILQCVLCAMCIVQVCTERARPLMNTNDLAHGRPPLPSGSIASLR